MITDTGCTGIDDCSKKVTKGLSDAWDELADDVQSGAGKVVEDVISTTTSDSGFDVMGIITNIEDSADENFGDLDFTDVASFLNGAFGSFSPVDLSGCPPDGISFWYMSPTDCGFFSDLEDVIEDFTKAEDKFDDAEDALKECASLTGALGFPTPFLKLKTNDYCLPDDMLLPLEYLLGAFQYISTTASAVTDSAITVISTLGPRIADFVTDVLGVNLIELGRELKSKHTAHMALSQSNASKTKKVKGNEFMIQVGLCFDFPTAVMTVSACIQLLNGEVNGNTVSPNLVFEFVLTREIWGVQSFDAGEPEPGFSFAFAFDEGYPEFIPTSEPRVDGNAGINIGLDAEIQGVAEAGVAVTIAFLPKLDPAAPTGFGLGIGVSRDAATDLIQKKMMAKVKESERHMKAQGQGHLATSAGVMAALHHLASDNHLETILSKMDRKLPLLLAQKMMEKPLHERMPQSVIQTSDGKSSPIKINGKIEATMGVGICLTMPDCNNPNR